MWYHFDEERVKKDFKTIKENLHCNFIRFFTIWPYFQPEPRRVNKHALEHFSAVIDIAAKEKLKVEPSLLIGHMSWLNWIPKWAVDWNKNWIIEWASDWERSMRRFSVTDGYLHSCSVRDIYTNGDMLRAERFLFGELISELKGKQNVEIVDIGNEPRWLYLPPDDAWYRSKIFRKWIYDHSRLFEKMGWKIPIEVTLGTLSEIDKEEKPEHIILSLHLYPKVDWKETKKAGKPIYREFEQLPEIDGLKTDVLIEEFGGACCKKSKYSRGIYYTEKYVPTEECQAMVYRDIFEKYGGNENIIGFVAWDFTDYWVDPVRQPLPVRVAEHEAYLGQIRTDRSLKLNGRVLRDFKP